MTETNLLRLALTEILVTSLSGDVPSGTPRHVPGRLGLPGKVTAVVGMRRAGKTTFLNQLRRERLAGERRARICLMSTLRMNGWRNSRGTSLVFCWRNMAARFRIWRGKDP